MKKMSKLQSIKRSNGSFVFSVNIPLEIIDIMKLKKGMELILSVEKFNEKEVIIISKEEVEEDGISI
jgi:hypothetical protein